MFYTCKIVGCRVAAAMEALKQTIAIWDSVSDLYVKMNCQVANTKRLILRSDTRQEPFLHGLNCVSYSGKVWRGESLANLANRPWFTKLKPSKLVVTINNLLADLFIRQIFFHQMLRKSKFAKVSPCQSFPLYGI